MNVDFSDKIKEYLRLLLSLGILHSFHISTLISQYKIYLERHLW